MCSNEEMNAAIGKLPQQSLPLGLLQSTLEQANLVAAVSVNALSVEEMLLGQNLRRRQESSLTAVLNGHGCGFQSNDGFAAANVSLQQSVHGRRTAEVANNLFQRPFLRGRRMKRQDPLQSFSNIGTGL